MEQATANHASTLSSQVASLEARLREGHELRGKGKLEAETSRDEITELKASNAKLKDALRKVDVQIKIVKPVFYAPTGLVTSTTRSFVDNAGEEKEEDVRGMGANSWDGQLRVDMKK